MQFNSYVFILAFLPVLILVYFALNRISFKTGKLWLGAASAFFYVYGCGIGNAWMLIFSILINYAFSHIISRINKYKKPVLCLAITANAAALLYFKYSGFIINNINMIFRRDFVFTNLILPLGISFFTFQQIMYVVGVYRGELKCCFCEYIMYILYFPKIIMGPMIEPTELIQQFDAAERKRINWDNIAYGIRLFSFGLFKKVILADTFSKAVAWGFENTAEISSADCFLIMLFYTFEIYFDFSGYSDMAVGVSKILNIDLPVNFNSPYKALSIQDFWKRWHMTLTGFLTKYIYIPLGGSRKGKLRTYVNIMIVFLVSGIWHGANWTFILWGLLHGALSIFDRLFDKTEKKLMEVIRWSAAFLSVNILWLLFRSESVGQWKNLLFRMFSFQNTEISKEVLKIFNLDELNELFKLLKLDFISGNVRGFNMLMFIAAAFAICLIPGNSYYNAKKNTLAALLASLAAFIWAILSLSGDSTFVYYNF